MIQITAETMDSLRQALRDMKDFTITCGKADQEENQELVHIQWTEDDHNFNKGWDTGGGAERCISSHRQLNRQFPNCCASYSAVKAHYARWGKPSGGQIWCGLTSSLRSRAKQSIIQQPDKNLYIQMWLLTIKYNWGLSADPVSLH